MSWGIFPHDNITDTKLVQGHYDKATKKPTVFSFKIGYTAPPFSTYKEVLVIDQFLFWVVWLFGSFVPIGGPMVILVVFRGIRLWKEYKLLYDFFVALFISPKDVYYEERSIVNWFLYPLRSFIFSDWIMPWIFLWSIVPGFNLLINWPLLMLLFWNIAY